MRPIQTNRISKLAPPVFWGHCISVHARRPQSSIFRKKRRSDRSKTPSAMTWAPFSRTSGGVTSSFLQCFTALAFSERQKPSEYGVQSTAFRYPALPPGSIRSSAFRQAVRRQHNHEKPRHPDHLARRPRLVALARRGVPASLHQRIRAAPPRAVAMALEHSARRRSRARSLHRHLAPSRR